MSAGEIALVTLAIVFYAALALSLLVVNHYERRVRAWLYREPVRLDDELHHMHRSEP